VLTHRWRPVTWASVLSAFSTPGRPGDACAGKHLPEPKTRKAPPEGRGGAFGSTAEADDLWRGGQGGGRPRSLEADYRSGGESAQTRKRKPSHARSAGGRSIKCPQPGASEQKKRLHPRMEPDDGAEAQSKVVANGRGRRIRHSPMDIGCGRRMQRQSGVAVLKPREEERAQSTSTRPNMPFDRLVSNAAGRMAAMRSVQGRSVVLTDHAAVSGHVPGKSMAPRWGELRGQVASGSAACLLKRRRREGGGNTVVCRLLR
jgi:hypothetical protein